MSAALVFALATSAAAQEAPHALRNTSGWFLAGEFVGAALLGFVGPDLLLAPPPEPLTCADAWCRTNAFDEAVQRALAADHARGVGTASHLFTVGLVPLVGFTGVIAPAVAAGEGIQGLQDSVVMLDAFMLATGVTSLAKGGARRQRPAFHYGRADRTEARDYPREEFLSFFSGDTTWAFTLAASATTLSALRGHESTHAVAIGTGLLALTGGTMRIVADMHWATDVLTGALVGTAVGVGVPLALHGRVADDGAPAATGPSLVRISGRW